MLITLTDAGKCAAATIHAAVTRLRLGGAGHHLPNEPAIADYVSFAECEPRLGFHGHMGRCTPS